MRSSKSQHGGEQDHQTDEVVPGPCHLRPMLPKLVTVRHQGTHSATAMHFQDRTFPAGSPTALGAVRTHSACRRRGT